MGLVQASFFEWAFHRYSLHRPWLPRRSFTLHALVHHQLCRNEDTFTVKEPEQEEALTFDWWAGIGLVALNALPWIAAAWALSRAGVVFPFVPFVSTVAATIYVYYLAYEGFHYLMHKPRFPWIERARFFRYLENHHRIHHIYMGRNFNVVLPLADLVTGTLMRKDPLPVRPTVSSARKIARVHSKFGRKIREVKSPVPPATSRPAPRKEGLIPAAGASAKVSRIAGA